MKSILRAGLVGAAASALALVLFEEVVRDLEATGFGDYEEYHHLWEAGWIAITRHGEWPLWNPHQCGGITQLGNPQTQVFHPLFYVSLLVGPTVGLKVFLLAHAALGIAGAYVLARSHAHLSIPAASLAAIGWAGSGYFAFHCGTGHANFIAFYLTPWLIVGWRRAMRDVRWAALVGGVMSATVLAGGVYAFPFFVFVVAHEAVWSLRRREWRGRVLAAGALAVLVTVLVGAIRLIPILDDLRTHPRDQASHDWMGPVELLRALTQQDLSWPMVAPAEHPWLWVEYTQYVGWPILLLALYGAWRAARSRSARWLVSGAALFALLTMGSFAPWAPWALIHRLPIYDSLKVPSRFGVLMLLHLTLLAGVGVDGLARAARRGLRRAAWARRLGSGGRAIALALAGLAALVGAADVTLAHRAVLEGKWRGPRIRRVAPLPFFVADRPPSVFGAGEDEHPVSAWFPQLNLGSGYCYSGMRYHGALGLWEGERPQARVSPEGELLDEGSTSATVWAVVEAPRSGEVTFNRTWAPGWESDLGPVARDSEERMVVPVPAGRRRVVLRYRPAGLDVALALTGLGVLLLIALAWLPRRVSDHRAAALGYGLLTLGALGVYARALARDPAPEPTSALEAGGAPRLRAAASAEAEAEIGDQYAAANAVDGRPETEWHLAEPGLGWLSVRLPTPRPVASVRLLNARNAPHLDRAARTARVVAFLDGVPVADSAVVEVPARFDGVERWRDVYLGAPRADRVLVAILESRGLSGGFAEVEIPERRLSYDTVVEVAASSSADDATDPTRARDRRVSTHWAPAAADPSPWIELSLAQPQEVWGLRLRRDGEPPPGLPARLEAWRDDELVSTREVALDAGETELRWPLGGRRANRVRLVFPGPASGAGPIVVGELGLY